MKQRLDQRQVQKLILAPALQQAIKLLPLTNLELIEVIDGELAQNPMLEMEEFESSRRKRTVRSTSKPRRLHGRPGRGRKETARPPARPPVRPRAGERIWGRRFPSRITWIRGSAPTGGIRGRSPRSKIR